MPKKTKDVFALNCYLLDQLIYFLYDLHSSYDENYA